MFYSLQKLSQRFKSKPLFLVLFGFILCISLVFSSASYSNAPTDVLFDGNKLFSLSDSRELTAAERVDRVTQRLQTAVKQQTPPLIEVENKDQFSLVLIDQKPILRVYPNDTEPELSPAQQSAQWANKMRVAIRQGRRERGQAYIRNSILLSIVIVAIATLLHWGLGKVWARPIQFMRQKFLSTSTDLSPAMQISLKISLTMTRVGIWLCTGLLITSLFPLTREWSALIRRGIVKGLFAPLFTIGPQSYSLANVGLLILMLMALLFAISTLANLLKSRVLPEMGISRGATEVITVIVRYSLISLGTVVLLQIWGLNLSSLTIVGSALGVGLGLGLQGIAKNLTSGLVLLFERSVQVGDYIQVSDFAGTVERISARNLIIKTIDKISVIIPSSMILENIVMNWSHESPITRIHIPVRVAQGTELKQVKEVLLQAASQHPQVLEMPSSDVLFKKFGESSLDFHLRVWIDQPSQEPMIVSDLMFEIDAQFRLNQIKVPFPHRDLHVHQLQD